MNYAPNRIRAEKDVIVRVYRGLRGKGVINVSPNQQVSPSDIIGTAQISPGFRTVNLSKLLGVAPKDISKYLKKSLGQKIYRGELLAYRKKWLLGGEKVVTSPSDGVLDFLNTGTGELRMAFLPQKADLPAGVFGIVEEVDKDKGKVVIKTQASILHGIFGSGRVRDGMLRIICKRDELISKSFISSKHGGEVIVGGSLIFKDAISDAISAGISGIITGGINAKDYKGMAGGRIVFPKKLENDIGVSIVACEGFGSIPIGEDIYEILQKYDGKFVSIDGNKGIIILPSFESDSIEKVKKTQLPLQDSLINSVDAEAVEIRAGVKVRIVGNSFAGEQGRVTALDKTETLLLSGIKAILATIETERRKIKVPVANLEVIM